MATSKYASAIQQARDDEVLRFMATPKYAGIQKARDDEVSRFMATSKYASAIQQARDDEVLRFMVTLKYASAIQQARDDEITVHRSHPSMRQPYNKFAMVIPPTQAFDTSPTPAIFATLDGLIERI
jgi:hypothetical protein